MSKNLIPENLRVGIISFLQLYIAVLFLRLERLTYTINVRIVGRYDRIGCRS